MSGWRKVLKPKTESVPQSKDAGPDKPAPGVAGRYGSARSGVVLAKMISQPGPLNGPAPKREAQSQKMTNRYRDKKVSRA